ncbi:hypothetical protein RDV89_01765 [Nocardioides zeae]|uniref:Membrane protein YczE n=1 Tax=Nocardioides imazamoxiresistens TaxID=3231893 RepID=A0ABU3PSB9_9ACTN|nr:hypothetical protein [Nocardioides zeae]MDT9591777.1 hypothetical protein [Nocardioides zeae]
MSTLVDLGPVAQLRAGRLPRRLVQMTVGLTLYGISLGMLVAAALGTAPWDVLHAGIATHVPLTIGQVLTLASFVVLLGWIPLREVPGIATLANPVVLGLAADATIAVLGDVTAPVERVALMVGGVVLCAFATALYIGAQLGRGPRDGLMTGLVRRTGASVRLVRTAIEVSVVVGGLLLGGVAGAGTVVFALAIGPLTQLMLPRLVVDLPGRGPAL